MLLSAFNHELSTWRAITTYAIMFNAASGLFLAGVWAIHTRPAWHPNWLWGQIAIPVYDRDLAEEFVALNEPGTVTLK
jgi:hypothetical protein